MLALLILASDFMEHCHFSVLTQQRDLTLIGFRSPSLRIILEIVNRSKRKTSLYADFLSGDKHR